MIYARCFTERAMSHPLRFLVSHCFYDRDCASRLRSFCSEGARRGTNGRSKVEGPSLTVRCEAVARRLNIARVVLPPGARLAALSILYLL